MTAPVLPMQDGCGQSPCVQTAPRPVSKGKAGRSRALDALRGLAIACMVVDHLALFLDAPDLRTTVGRVAMPLFFILGGHLATRVSWRLLSVAGVGLVLQLLAPWSGAGPLLLTFVAGAVVLAHVRKRPAALALLVAVGLTLGANGYARVVGGAYDPYCLVGLMALGALLPRPALTFLDAVPTVSRPLAWVGRWPLTVYAGHVLLLTALWA